MLSNAYAYPGLFRREIFERLEGDSPTDGWPSLAQLYLGGAHIVSIPLTLIARAVEPETLETHPQEALAVAQRHERALPDSASGLARLAAGLEAAETGT